MDTINVTNKKTCINEVQVELQGTMSVSLTANDIFNWITHCDNVETLRYLGGYALRLADTISNAEDNYV